jgi:hypothetical protein
MSDYYSATNFGPLFDKPAAACTAKAARVAGFDTAKAKETVLAALRRSSVPLTGEQLVDHCVQAGIVPHDQRAFGSVFAGLARDGLIESAGFTTRTKGHGTGGARLWRVA